MSEIISTPQIFKNLTSGFLDTAVTNQKENNVISTSAAAILENPNTSDEMRIMMSMMCAIARNTATLSGDIVSLQEDVSAIYNKLAINQPPSIHNHELSEITRISNSLDNLAAKINTPIHSVPPPKAPAQHAPPPRQQSSNHDAAIWAAESRRAKVKKVTERPIYPIDPPAPETYAAKAVKAKSKGRAPQPAPGQPPAAKPLPTAQRRFFASRTTQEPLPHSERLASEIPSLLAKLLEKSGHAAPYTSLSATINPKGSISVVAHPTVPTSFYNPFFEAFTAVINARINSPSNPLKLFRPAPTDVDVAIHGIPLYNFPTKAALDKDFPEEVRFTVGITSSAVRFLNKDNISRNAKTTSSVVITVSAEEAAQIDTTIRLFSRPRQCATMWTATPLTQCRNCQKFGHASQGCKAKAPTCPLCAKAHIKADHRCQNSTCPGLAKPISDCCPVSSAKCSNCQGPHPANSPSCPVRPKRSAAKESQPLTAPMENAMDIESPVSA